MFSRIQNPETGKWVNVNGSAGQKILKNYLKQSGGVPDPLQPVPKNIPVIDKPRESGDRAGIIARQAMRDAIPKLMEKFKDLKETLKLEVVKEPGGNPESIVADIDKLTESLDPLMKNIGIAAKNLFTADEAPLKLSNLQKKLDPLRQAFEKYNEELTKQ